MLEEAREPEKDRDDKKAEGTDAKEDKEREYKEAVEQEDEWFKAECWDYGRDVKTLLDTAHESCSHGVCSSGRKGGLDGHLLRAGRLPKTGVDGGDRALTDGEAAAKQNIEVRS
ncbi:hypothetical protein NDU88_001027 [Pleurodeles waltl]|uniref:Uncharacterized protein n=1 Tax=Pleurodeles waltl TaxID=8319 RepID=A0AAV7LBK1_PLEWA|nr:hypothetical protein NDU88_001027 [Pleurodeles waltl]